MPQCLETIQVWPIMDIRFCHCGYSISHAKQTDLFDKKWLDSLEKTHVEMHQIARVLLVQYQQGDIEQARDGLTELEAVFNAIVNLCE